MKWSFLSGDIGMRSYGGKLVSPKLNNGEFDYWVVIEIINLWDCCGQDSEHEFCVTVCVISPDEAGDENLEKACRSYGRYPSDVDDLTVVDYLHSYGVYSQVWIRNGNCLRELIREAKRFAETELRMLFGFVMDRPVNRIGTTGWESLRGDLDSALARTIASGSPDGRILGKMYGVR